MDEGQELGAGGDQGSDELFLLRREAEAAEEDLVGRRTMSREGPDRGEVAEAFQRGRVVVEEGAKGPDTPVVGMLPGPGVHLAAEAAGADDEEFLHVRKGGRRGHGRCDRRGSGRR